MTAADLVDAPDGLQVMIRSSKTDQKGKGQEIAIPRGYMIRPVEHVEAWLTASGIPKGRCSVPCLKGSRLQAVPLTSHSAAQILKAYAKRGWTRQRIASAGRSSATGSKNPAFSSTAAA